MLISKLCGTGKKKNKKKSLCLAFHHLALQTQLGRFHNPMETSINIAHVQEKHESPPGGAHLSPDCREPTQPFSIKNTFFFFEPLFTAEKTEQDSFLSLYIKLKRLNTLGLNLL